MSIPTLRAASRTAVSRTAVSRTAASAASRPAVSTASGAAASRPTASQSSTSQAPASLAPAARPPLRRRRALGTFAGAYAAVTVLCPLLYWALAAALHKPLASSNPFHDPTYVLAQKFFPLVNLVVWTAFALLYLRRGDRRQALALGRLWLCLALPVDFVGFVVIRNPMSLGPHDFYVSQFPWIYLTYAAVFLGPLCAARISKVSSEA